MKTTLSLLFLSAALAVNPASASPLVLESSNNGFYKYGIYVDPHSGTGIAFSGTISLTGLYGVTGASRLDPNVSVSFTSNSVSIYAPSGEQLSNQSDSPFVLDLFSLTSTARSIGNVSYVFPAGYATFSGTIGGPVAPEPSTVLLLATGLLLGVAILTRKRFRSSKALGVLGAAVLLSHAAVAGAIYNNGAPNHYGGLTIQTPYNVADDFELSASANIGAVTFYYAYNINDPIQNLTYEFYDSSNNAPDHLLETGSVAALNSKYLGSFDSGRVSYEWVATFNVTPLSLQAGQYFLGLSSATQSTPNAGGDRYGWESAPANSSTVGAQYDFGGGFAPFPNAQYHELAFALQGVPEPATEVLLGLGLTVVGLRARRHHTKNGV